MKQLTSANFIDFDATPLFIGEYTGVTLTATEDDTKKNRKKGDIMGFEFQTQDGILHLVGASATVTSNMLPKDKKGKDLPVIPANTVLSFEFLGMGENKANQEFRRFRIFAFDDWEEAEKYHAKAVKK